MAIVLKPPQGSPPRAEGGGSRKFTGLTSQAGDKHAWVVQPEAAHWLRGVQKPGLVPGEKRFPDQMRLGPAKAAGCRTDAAELPAGQECGGWEEVRGDQTEPAGGPVAGRGGAAVRRPRRGRCKA